MNNYLEQFEKYKNYQLPQVDEVFKHPTEHRGDRLPIEYRILQYNEEKGLVETIHSGRKVEKTLQWIRKMYNKE